MDPVQDCGNNTMAEKTVVQQKQAAAAAVDGIQRTVQGSDQPVPIHNIRVAGDIV